MLRLRYDPVTLQKRKNALTAMYPSFVRAISLSIRRNSYLAMVNKRLTNGKINVNVVMSSFSP
jgi:hypothetical protein